MEIISTNQEGKKSPKLNSACEKIHIAIFIRNLIYACGECKKKTNISIEMKKRKREKETTKTKHLEINLILCKSKQFLFSTKCIRTHIHTFTCTPGQRCIRMWEALWSEFKSFFHKSFRKTDYSIIAVPHVRINKWILFYYTLSFSLFHRWTSAIFPCYSLSVEWSTQRTHTFLLH